MAVSPASDIESQFARLPTEGQLSLLERLVHNLRQSFEARQGSWEADLSAMAADRKCRENSVLSTRSSEPRKLTVWGKANGDPARRSLSGQPQSGTRTQI